jgi:hypothetical protein
MGSAMHDAGRREAISNVMGWKSKYWYKQRCEHCDLATGNEPDDMKYGIIIGDLSESKRRLSISRPSVAGMVLVLPSIRVKVLPLHKSG